MKREISSLVLGLAFGALGVGAARLAFPAAPRASDSAAAALDVAVPPPLARPAAPWVPPAQLSSVDAAIRVDAWLAGEGAAADLNALRALLPVLPADQFRRLAEALLARRGGEARTLFQEVFDGWVERDAGGAAQWAGALAENSSLNGRARRLLREQAALAWARDDLDAALAWAHALPDAGGEWGAAAMIYGQLAQRDPRRALALARARRDDAFYQKASIRIYDGWSVRDPAGALQGLGAQLMGQGMKFYNLSGDIGRWAAQDPEAALRWVLATDSGEGSGISSLMHSLAKNGDGAVLASALVTASGQAPRTDLIGYFVNNWVRRDSAGARAWLDQLPDAALRTKIIQEASGWSSSEAPWDTLDLAVLLPAGVDRDNKIVARVSAWAKLDPDAALTWLKTHDEPAAASAVQAQLIGGLARKDRAAALASLQTLAPGKEKRTATREVVAVWAESAPAEAAAWLVAAGASGTEHYNYQDWGVVVKPWFARDPAEVRDWINAQPDAALREEAGGAWTLQLINSPLSHAERSELIVGVKDEARQRQDMFNIAAHWFRVDAEGARAWIQASSLPQATKDSVIQAYHRPAARR